MATASINMRSEYLKRDVSINVVLPFDKSGRPPYQTLFLLHGLKGSCNAWIENTHIARAATDRNMAVVMPSGENRFYVNSFREDSVYGDYERFLVEELVEKMREVFPLSHEREKTYICGFSMGGYGSLRNGLKYRDTFGKVGVFAGAVHFFERDAEFVMSEGNVAGEALIFSDFDEKRETDLNPRWIMEQIAKDAKAHGVPAHEAFPKLKFFVGKDDEALCMPNVNLAKRLEELGADVHYDVTPGGHTWDFVDEHLNEMLDWFVGKEQLPTETGEID